MSFKRKVGYLFAFLLVVVGVAIYAYSCGNEFVFDDEVQVVGNPAIHSLANLPYFFRGSTYANGNSMVGAGIYYKPFTVLTYALLWWLFPDTPMGFHGWQLFLAITNALLVFRFLRTFMSERAAGIAALIFLAHPINTETIAYIGDLQDVLYTFFGLLALNWLVTARAGLRNGLITMLLLLSSLMAKESGLLYLAATCGWSLYIRPTWRRSAFAASFSALGIYLGLRLGLAHMSHLVYQANQIGRADWFGRLITAPLVLGMYLGKFFVPLHFTTTQDWIVNELSLPQFWLPLLALVVLIAAHIWYLRRLGPLSARGRIYGYFSAWLIVGLLFHSHILVPLDGTFADRWFYFPCIGLCAMLGFWFESTLQRGWALGLAAIVVCALGARSFVRASDWVDGFTLAEHEDRKAHV